MVLWVWKLQGLDINKHIYLLISFIHSIKKLLFFLLVLKNQIFNLFLQEEI